MTSPKANYFWNRFSNADLIRYLLLIALGWAVVQILAYFESVLVIFTFAAILAFLLNYPVQWASRFLPHSAAVTVVFLSVCLLTGGLVATLGLTMIAQLQSILNQIPQLIGSINELLEQLQRVLESRNLTVDFAVLEEGLQNFALSGLGLGLTTVQGLLLGLVDLVLIAVVAFFMLLDGNRLWNLSLRLFPESLRPHLTDAIQSNFLGFFWGRLLLSLFFGVSAFVVFVILGVPYALALAAIAGVFDLIPGIGATIGITLVSLIILPQGLGLSLKVLMSCILLQQVEENVMMPRIMQGSINMNPVVLFFALLVGARVAGLVGVFLSIPVAGVLISLFAVEEMRGK